MATDWRNIQCFPNEFRELFVPEALRTVHQASLTSGTNRDWGELFRAVVNLRDWNRRPDLMAKLSECTTSTKIRPIAAEIRVAAGLESRGHGVELLADGSTSWTEAGGAPDLILRCGGEEIPVEVTRIESVSSGFPHNQEIDTYAKAERLKIVVDMHLQHSSFATNHAEKANWEERVGKLAREVLDAAMAFGPGESARKVRLTDGTVRLRRCEEAEAGLTRGGWSGGFNPLKLQEYIRSRIAQKAKKSKRWRNPRRYLVAVSNQMVPSTWDYLGSAVFGPDGSFDVPGSGSTDFVSGVIAELEGTLTCCPNPSALREVLWHEMASELGLKLHPCVPLTVQVGVT